MTANPFLTAQNAPSTNVAPGGQGYPDTTNQPQAQGFQAQPQAPQAPQGFQAQPQAQPQGFQAQPQAQGFQAQPQAQGFQAQPQAPAGFANPSGAGAPDPFGTPPGGGDGSRIQDDIGAAVLVRPEEYIESMRTSKGETSCIRADWAVLDGPNAGALRSNALVFGKVTVRDLKKILDGPQRFLVGRVGRGEARNGNDAPFIFIDAPEAMDAARHAAAQLGWV